MTESAIEWRYLDPDSPVANVYAWIDGVEIGMINVFAALGQPARYRFKERRDDPHRTTKYWEIEGFGIYSTQMECLEAAEKWIRTGNVRNLSIVLGETAWKRQKTAR